MLKAKVDALYQSKRAGRADWADWLYTHHVFLVADKAEELARRFGANQELSAAAGMLHDIADATMSRFAPDHAEMSAEVAREFLYECGFTAEEMHVIIDDAMARHNCRAGIPVTMEGKIVATADAVVHLCTDYYERTRVAQAQAGMSQADISDWSLKKIERDFNDKILFPEVREDARDAYERLKGSFSDDAQ